MNKIKKIVLGVIIAIIGFFAIGLGSVTIWQWADPEGYAAHSEANEQSILIHEQEQKERDARAQAFQKFMDSANREPEPWDPYPTTLPESCSGVNSMELDLYPTGKQCFDELNQRVEKWCYVKYNGHKVLREDCTSQFYQKLAEQCKDPVIGSTEVCLMHTLKEMYPKLVP